MLTNRLTMPCDESLRRRRAPCGTCNDLDFRGHQRTDLDEKELVLDFAFQNLDTGCPFCRLLTASIESLVNEDHWKARVVLQHDEVAPGQLTLKKGEPIVCNFWFRYYSKSSGRDVASHRRIEDVTLISGVRFIVYSEEDVSIKP